MEWCPQPNLYASHIRAMVAKGRGMGAGASYRPWLNAREGRRGGSVGQPLGIKTGRKHVLSNQLQRAYFFLRERQAAVVDIRERFPILNFAQTLEVCAEHNIDHPTSGATPVPFVIDFLVTTIDDGRPAFEARDLITPDLDRLRVKQAWCERHGIPWSAVDTSQLTKQLLDSLLFVRGWYRHRYQPDGDAIARLVKCFEGIYERHLTLLELRNLMSSKMKQAPDLLHNQLLYAAWSGLIPVDLSHQIRLDAPVILRDA